MTGPKAIASEALLDLNVEKGWMLAEFRDVQRPNTDAQAEVVLSALRDAGWRIVRTEPVKPTWIERDWRIAAEWEPSDG